MYSISQEDKDAIFKLLNERQKEFISLHVKRGKKTIFANIMAKDKGHVLPVNATNEEIERILDEWVLDDYIDNQFVNPDTPCECGRALRYQYIVRHKQTNEVRRFGKSHFELHMGFDANLIREILKGFNSIDYEYDEILYKLSHGWDINIINKIPPNMVIPTDIKESLDLNIPLLDRQYTRLVNKIRDWNQIEDTRPRKELDPSEVIESDNNDYKPRQESLFPEFEKVNKNNDMSVALDYIVEGISSARVICELLIKNHHFSGKRFSGGKPHIYIDVISFFMELEKENVIERTGEISTEDSHWKHVQ